MVVVASWADWIVDIEAHFVQSYRIRGKIVLQIPGREVLQGIWND